MKSGAGKRMEKAFLSAILIGVAIIATTLCCLVLM